MNANQCMVCRLNFDRRTGQYSSTSDDITVSVPGFGSTETVETMSRGLILTFPYFKGILLTTLLKEGIKEARAFEQHHTIGDWDQARYAY